MAKSKKKKQNSFSNQELEQDINRATELVKDSIPSDAEFVVTPTPRKMIIRKEVQKEIDVDKDIRRLLRTGYYNYNQIASMIRGANLERVKQVDNERRKT